MATEAQIAANRRNALLSTGPKTPRGRNRVRHNALRHGLYADQLVALGESDSDFAAHAGELCAALRPQDAFEILLIRRLALIVWRTDRLASVEAAMLNAAADREHRRRSFAGKPPLDVWPEDLTPLSRHEAALDRAFQRTMTLLRQHRGDRRAAEPNAPIAIRNFAEQSQFFERIQVAEPGNEANGKANSAALPPP